MTQPTADFSECTAIVLDDSGLMLELFKSVLKAFAFREVRTYSDVNLALQDLEKNYYSCLVTDWLMYPVNGLEITRKIRHGIWGRDREIPIVMCSGYTDMKHIREGLESGVSEILSKPVTPASIYDKVYQAIFCPRPFVETETYVGPELRIDLSALGEKPKRHAVQKPEDDDGLALI